MNTFLTARPSRCLLSALGIVLGVALLAPAEFFTARTQEEPCQEPARNPDWPIFRSGDVIWTDFDSSISPEMREQIRRGIESWNNSNAAQCSGVTFTPSDPDLVEPNRPEPAYVHYRYAPLYNEDESIDTSTVARFNANY